MKNDRGTLGVLGGMGPAATVDLLDKIVQATPARCDQEHLEVVVVSNPGIPDRSAAILGKGPDPLPAMLDGMQRLLRLEPDLILLPCNTAHYWFDQLQRNSPVPLLHMINAVAKRAEAFLGRNGVVGLMATSGTLAAHLYQAGLGQLGLVTRLPGAATQKEVMEIIQGVKAGRPRQELRFRAHSVARELRRGGADLLVLGCTELPLLLDADTMGIPLLDATRILAEDAVEVIRGQKQCGPG